MRGEFFGIWPLLVSEIWVPLEGADPDLPESLANAIEGLDFPEEYEGHSDLFSGLFREAYRSLKDQIKNPVYGDQPSEIIHEGIDLSEITSEPVEAMNALFELDAASFKSEAALIEFLERAHDVCAEYDDILATRYKALLQACITKYSLRYELVDPCSLYPTVSGAFASLIHEIENLSSSDPNLDFAILDFKMAYRDYRKESSEGRVRNCVQKLVTLAEAAATRRPDITCNTLGAACNQLTTWPHGAVKDALSNLYGFASNYPGIRHAGNQDGKLRDLDHRDLIAMSVILAGFMPYLVDEIDCGVVYLNAKELPLEDTGVVQ